MKTMKKKLFITALVCFLLVGCTTAINEKETTFIVEDALGREVEFSEYPNKIVVVGKQTPMLANFFYLFPSKSDRVLAIENRSQSINTFLNLIDPTFGDKLILEKGAGVEQIAPLSPDLVVLKTSMKDSLGDSLEEVDIPILYVSFENIDEIYRDLMALAIVLDDADRGEYLINEYKEVVSYIDARVSKSDVSKDILIMQAADVEQAQSFLVPSSQWLQTNMVSDLYANPVWASAATAGGWTDISIEQVFSWKPEKILIINYKGLSSDAVRNITESDLWDPFLTENDIEVYPFPYDFQSWDQPDPRWILGYSWIAHKIQPESIGTEYMLDLVKNFYTSFYELEEVFINEEIIPLASEYIQ